METKICSMFNIEKHIEDFYNKYTECNSCDSRRNLKRYYENKDKLSNQRKIYYEKSKYIQLQKQIKRNIHFEELGRSYIELENRLTAMEEKISNID